MKNREDISGNRYGRLVAISYHHFSAKQRQTFWLCQCDCGRKVIVGKSHLKDGHTKSCGCLQREVSSKVTSARNYKHGHTNKRTVRKFEYNGNIYTIPGFANKIGMSRSALYDRFYRGNWDVDKVIKKLKLDNLIK